jgi:DNA-binding HxlR family transcriptional regulator
MNVKSTDFEEIDPCSDALLSETAAHADETFCPINAALTLSNGRWTPHIVHAMLGGRTRFNDMARCLGVNPRTLRERLRELEQEGIVARTVISQMPPIVEYTLTPKGRALETVFQSLSDWGRTWLPVPAE